MAHENRAENRRKAKEAAGEQMNELDLLEEAFAEDDNEENEAPQEVDTSETDDEEKEINEVEDALKGTTPAGVKKEGEEEVKTTEEGKKEPEKKEETPPAEKKEAVAEKKPEEKEPEKKPEPGEKKAEPAPKQEEKKPEEKKDQQEPPKQLTDDEANKLFSDWRVETETALANYHYKMTDKDVEEFNENPAAWVPKAMARVYLDSISAGFQQFTMYLPRMVDQVLTARTQRSEREAAFFSKWEELIPHKETVYRLATAYRKANPTANLEQFINEVGAQAMVALGITPKTFVAEEKKEEKKPFTPAGTTASSTEPPKKKATNPFDVLAQEFSMEDLPES